MAIERTERFAFRRPGDDTAVVRGATLEMDDGCPTWWLPFVGTCRVDYAVRVPPGVAVEIDTSNGDVVVTGVDGDGRVDTADGTVVLVSVGGDIVVDTSNGSVDGRDLTSAAVDVDTSNGDLILGFAKAPQIVIADTSNGNITLELFEGVYRVMTSAGHGDVDIAVATEPEAERLVDVETGGGDITIRRG